MRRAFHRSLGGMICVCLLLVSTAACGTGGGATHTGTSATPSPTDSTPSDKTSSDTASQEAESTQVYRKFTVDALRPYAENHTMSKYRPHTELGAATLHGSGDVTFSQPVADDDMYFAVFMCKESKPEPYSIGVRDSDGHSYTILKQDACVDEAVQGAGLPATRLKHGTAMTVKAADTTDIVIITYKFKASLTDGQ
ncbi:hypothetical protein [Bifidobacterium thermophilum]|uniref:Lipoprotein n=1 Tax=Bifidobacterium thermophilum RBL67 TaxID=1254439 RepID=M4RCB9_9BIFI|nr:hypothetical protein [Bifidobacterium thermophilum]AGH41110.1 hypothetical protein D805_0843 [Bifidobacterium thermophilum RBL67]MDW8486127.1 hypothetical protein [Bifidobacterium thermophilum]